ncbi:MAG: hypothetical protein VX123_13380, partial [Pseudomonadota bacterium]|nr:hypothetical protein [Pseudomonadota bacterium]
MSPAHARAPQPLNAGERHGANCRNIPSCVDFSIFLCTAKLKILDFSEHRARIVYCFYLFFRKGK